MKLIEIIPAYFTAHATTERCRQLVTALGKRDVVCRATPGFIVNRMARPYYGRVPPIGRTRGARAADRPCPQGRRALSYGAARADRFYRPDINYQVSRQIWQDMQYDARYTPGHLQRSLVDAGLLGKRTAAPILPSKKTPRR